MHQLARGLKEKLPLVEGSDEKEAAAGEPASLRERITMQTDRPWWDVSEVKAGLKPFELHKRLNELSGQLAGLIFYSDSLDARQSMLEAIHVLRAAESSLKDRANNDVSKEATNG